LGTWLGFDAGTTSAGCQLGWVVMDGMSDGADGTWLGFDAGTTSEGCEQCWVVVD
jgi:hypothetical protein